MPNDSKKIPGIFSANPPGLTEKLQSRKVFIAGAGGLGSNVANLLTRAGIGGMAVADFDTVSPSNLNRQQFTRNQIGIPKVDALRGNLLAINPQLDYTGKNFKLTPENFAMEIQGSVDLIFECFDNPIAKAELIRFCLTQRKNIPCIAVSGLAGCGPLESITVQRKSDNFYLIGDGVSDVDSGLGTLSTRVVYAAAIQAHLGISLISQSD